MNNLNQQREVGGSNSSNSSSNKKLWVVGGLGVAVGAIIVLLMTRTQGNLLRTYVDIDPNWEIFNATTEEECRARHDEIDGEISAKEQEIEDLQDGLSALLSDHREKLDAEERLWTEWRTLRDLERRLEAGFVPPGDVVDALRSLGLSEADVANIVTIDLYENIEALADNAYADLNAAIRARLEAHQAYNDVQASIAALRAEIELLDAEQGEFQDCLRRVGATSPTPAVSPAVAERPPSPSPSPAIAEEGPDHGASPSPFPSPSPSPSPFPSPAVAERSSPSPIPTGS